MLKPSLHQVGDYMEGSVRHWSCCDETIEYADHEAQVMAHKETGCETGRHNWRPHKRADRSKKDGPADLNWDLEDLPRGAQGKVKHMHYMY